jgi:hypothetical protein
MFSFASREEHLRQRAARGWTEDEDVLVCIVEIDRLRAEARAAPDPAPLDATTRMLRLAAIDSCIYIVQQSLDTVKAEDDGESRSIKTSIAARAHVIALLTAYRDIEYAKEQQP